MFLDRNDAAKGGCYALDVIAAEAVFRIFCRLRRKQYWLWGLFVVIAQIVLMDLDSALGPGPDPKRGSSSKIFA